MSEPLRQSIACPHGERDVDATLFGWRGGGIVLFGHFSEDRWTLARGWLTADALTDVRRWNFATSRAFAGQVRRLVQEASGDSVLARSWFAAALAWAETQPTHQQP